MDDAYAWGPYLLESDTHYDIASYLSDEAGIYLINPKDYEAARAHLNNGVLERLFEDNATASDVKFGCTKKLRFMILGFLAMRIGATIKPEHMELLRGICGKALIPEAVIPEKYALPMIASEEQWGCDFYGLQMEQFIIAVTHYKNNGKPYRDNSRRIIMTNEFGAEWQQTYLHSCVAPGCGMTNVELEGKKLEKCACNQVAYCGRECQKEDWRYHKGVCTMKKENAKETGSEEIKTPGTDPKESDAKEIHTLETDPEKSGANQSDTKET